MLSVPGLLSQSTPSLTISETDSLYMAVTTLHHELKSYAPEPCGNLNSSRDETVDGSLPGCVYTTDTGECMSEYCDA